MCWRAGGGRLEFEGTELLVYDLPDDLIGSHDGSEVFPRRYYEGIRSKVSRVCPVE